MNINKTKILDYVLNNFINIKNIVNFNFLACYKNLFCKMGIKNNIGEYIILFHLITIIIFNINQFHILKKKVSNTINTRLVNLVKEKLNLIMIIQIEC